MATRRERVVLEVEDQFTREIVKAAVAVAALKRELGGLSNEAVQTSKTTRTIERDVDNLGSTAKRTEKDIDKLSGRLRILAEVGAVIAPAIAPIGAVSVAAIGGLANQLGFAAAGAGVTVLAFQGLGDALKAMNKAELEPTAANLAEVEAQLSRLSPAAADFARQLSSLSPGLRELRDLAATGLFPGLSRGLEGLEGALPRVERLISTISNELGDIAGDAGTSLGSARWSPFLDFLADEGPEALRQFADAAGNTGHALAELWMATDPLNDSFGDWLVGATADLDRWAQGLSQTQGFADFLAYVEETGPQVGETLGALANATLQIVEAMAPLGGPVLAGLEAAADVVAAIADSDLGAPIFAAVAALSLFNRTLAITDRLTQSTGAGLGSMATRAKALNVTGGGIARGAAGAAGLGLAASGALEGTGISNTVSLGLAGAAFGPYGAAAGLAVGGVMDLVHANDDLEDSLRRVDAVAATGNLDEMRAEFDRLADSGQDVAASALETKIQFEETNREFDRTNTAALLAERGITLTSEGFKDAGQSADEFRTSLIAAKEALDAEASFDAYQASLDRFYESLKENGKTLDATTEQGRDNRENLRQIAADAIAFSETLDATNGKVFLDKARRSFIRARVAAGDTREAARKLADDLGLVNRVKVAPKFDSSGIDAGIAKAGKLATLLAGLNRPGVRTPTPNNAPGTVDNLLGQTVSRAEGGTIPGARFPYGDRVPALLAPGEEVVSNRFGQADRNRDLLKAINQNRFADGTPGLRGYIRNDLDMKFPQTIKQWERALEKSTKVLDKERSKREDVLSQADSLRSAIASQYRSDLFGQQSGNVWMSDAERMKSGKGDIFATLNGDIRNLDALNAAERKLKAKGLDSGAFAELVSNASLQEVQAFANGSKADVLKFEQLYNRREQGIRAAGNVGADAAFGAQLRVANAQVAEARKATAALNRAVNLLERNPKATGDEISKAIRGAAPKRGRK